MFVERKKINTGYKSKVAQVDFENKNNANAIVEKSCLNCIVKDGALCSARGVDTVLFNAKLYAAYGYNGGMLYFLKKQVNYDVDGTAKYVSGASLPTPTCLPWPKHNCLLVSDPNSGTYSLARDKMSKFTEEGFNSMAISHERLVGLRDNKLYISERDDATKFVGTLQLDSDVVAVLEYGDDVIAVGDEIYKIQLSDDLKNTKVTSLMNNVGNVYYKTVCFFGNKLMLLTDRGLYCYYQNKLTRLCEDVEFPTTNVAAATDKDGFWITIVSDGKRRVMNLTNNGERRIYDIEATAITSGDGQLIFLVDELGQKFSDKPAALSWLSKKYYFGNQFETKYFRKMYIVTKGKLEVHLVTEKERKIYNVPAGKHKIPLKGSFRQVAVEIYSTEEAQVEQLALRVQSYGREVKDGNYNYS